MLYKLDLEYYQINILINLKLMSCLGLKFDDIKPENITEHSPNRRYQKTNILCGRGGYKQVWIAIDTAAKLKQDKLVIWSDIKVPKSKVDKKRILNEISVMKTIDSESTGHLHHLVGYLGSWYQKENDTVVLITDYANQGSLGDMINRYRKSDLTFTNEFITRVLFQILTALKYLHQLQLIHRDLKPDNIVIKNQDVVKIIDFGISTKIPDKPPLKRQLSVTSNNPGEFSTAGTPEFMAPEVWSGREFAVYNEKVDIYAVGWILYSLLRLTDPFIGRVPKPITTVVGITIYQSVTYRNYRAGEISVILDRELAKIANLVTPDKEEIPDMKYITDHFINNREPSPFPNKTLNYLDFFKDCVLSPDQRLSAQQLIRKYYTYDDSKYDPFSADYQGHYISFGG